MEAPSPLVKPFATLFLADEQATAALADGLAPRLGAGDVILLKGDLGAGKTSFARALIRALCGPETEVPSPTFTLMQVYEAGDLAISHFDLYRLSEPEDILEIGWHAAREGLVLVEWPDRLAGLEPETALVVDLTFAGDGRRAQFFGSDEWRTVLTIDRE